MKLVVRIGKKNDEILSLYGGLYYADRPNVQGATFWTGARKGPTNIRGHAQDNILNRLACRFQREYQEFFSVQVQIPGYLVLEDAARSLCNIAKEYAADESRIVLEWEMEFRRLATEESALVFLNRMDASAAQWIESIDWESLFPPPDWAF